MISQNKKTLVRRLLIALAALTLALGAVLVVFRDRIEEWTLQRDFDEFVSTTDHLLEPLAPGREALSRPTSSDFREALGEPWKITQRDANSVSWTYIAPSSDDSQSGGWGYIVVFDCETDTLLEANKVFF